MINHSAYLTRWNLCYYCTTCGKGLTVGLGAFNCLLKNEQDKNSLRSLIITGCVFRPQAMNGETLVIHSFCSIFLFCNKML